jgi:hypothetical protein
MTPSPSNESELALPKALVTPSLPNESELAHPKAPAARPQPPKTRKMTPMVRVLSLKALPLPEGLQMPCFRRRRCGGLVRRLGRCRWAT